MPTDDSGLQHSMEGRIPLVAGPLTMELDTTTGFLRYLCFGDREVLRGIYAAVRDRNWGTVAPALHQWQIDRDSQSFRIAFAAECREKEIDFLWQGNITGTREGTVEYRLDGVARSTFLRARIGLCVLHGSEACAGRDCIIEHSNGSHRNARFPRDISPHQPFRNVRAISHEVLPGKMARVIVQGDTFETEDQRNWTDASFKTYCPPLALPFPVEVQAGTRVQQSVKLQLIDHRPAESATRRATSMSGEIPITLGYGPRCHLPRLGLCLTSPGTPLSRRVRGRLRRLSLDHLRVDLELGRNIDFLSALQAADTQARLLRSSLHIAVTFNRQQDDFLRQLADAVHAVQPPVTAWLIYDRRQVSTSIADFHAVRKALGRVTPNAAFALGSNANFAELNRNRPPAGLADWICYSINPQVHACDDASLVETLAVQRDTVTTARAFAGSSPIAVSPVTLKPRYNAVATGPESVPLPGELPPQVDPRQATLFAAGWTLGSIAALASGGAESITYYETSGWCGVLETDEGCPIPERFPSSAGCVFPVYHLFADLAGATGSDAWPLIATPPRTVHGLLLRQHNGSTLWLANLTSRPQMVELPEAIFRSDAVRMRILEQRNVMDAMTSPETFRRQDLTPLVQRQLLLSAHAFIRIDCSV